MESALNLSPCGHWSFVILFFNLVFIQYFTCVHFSASEVAKPNKLAPLILLLSIFLIKIIKDLISKQSLIETYTQLTSGTQKLTMSKVIHRAEIKVLLFDKSQDSNTPPSHKPKYRPIC